MKDILNIWNDVKKGDRAAQKQLYENSCKDLMNVCKRYLPEGVTHLDAIQETYIKIFTKSKSYDSNKGSLGAWMARIAVNECLNILRKQKSLVMMNVTKTDLEPQADEDVVSQLSAEEIYKEVERLPIGYRTVFNLYIVEGYSHKEIGEMIDISPSSSRSQLTRAKMILKKIIKKKTNLNRYEAIK